MSEAIRGGHQKAAPTWEERHPVSLLYERGPAIRWRLLSISTRADDTTTLVIAPDGSLVCWTRDRARARGLIARLNRDYLTETEMQP